VHVEQGVRRDAAKAASKAKAAAKKQKSSTATRRRGRPKGRKNKNKAEGTLTPELGRITRMITALLQRMAAYISLTYLVLDGHVGTHNALPMARQCHMHLISTLRSDSALYLPYTGPYAGRGPHRTSGDKVDDDNLPVQYLKETTVEKHVTTALYQRQLLHKEFVQPLPVVLIVKTNLQTQARAHVVLLRSALGLASDKLVDY
jgi:hypothetical protein